MTEPNAKEAATGGKVIDLMEVLKESLRETDEWARRFATGVIDIDGYDSLTPDQQSLCRDAASWVQSIRAADTEEIKRLNERAEHWAGEADRFAGLSATDRAALIKARDMLREQDTKLDEKQQECDELYAELSSKVSARDQEIIGLRAELQNIVTANPRAWDFEVRDATMSNFEQWAKSRALLVLSAAAKPLGGEGGNG